MNCDRHNALAFARPAGFATPMLLALLLAGCQPAPAGKPALRVAISTDIPPYVMKQATTGIEVDLVRQLLSDYDVQFIPMPWGELQTAILQKRADAAVGLQHFSDDGVFYSGDIVTFQNFAISKAASGLEIDSVADLANLKVLAWEDAYLVLGPEFQRLFSAESPQRKNYVEFADQSNQVRAFWQDEADVIVIDRSIFSYLSEEMGHSTSEGEFHTLFPTVTNFKVGFKEAAVRDVFDQGRVELCMSGGYTELLAHYRMKLPRTICEQ